MALSFRKTNTAPRPPAGCDSRWSKVLSPLDQADGVALVLVLWVLVILTVIVGEFTAASRSQIQLAGNFMETGQAHFLAVSGLEQVMYDMATDTDFFNLHLPDEPDAADGEKPFRWRINADNIPFQYGAGWFKVRIDNAAGKVNINRADRRLLRMIVDGFDIDAQQKDVIVDAILDWRDEDSTHRLNGAEDDYYEDIGASHLCKDGDFDSIDELQFVRGVTPELFRELEPLFTIFPKNDDETMEEMDEAAKTGDAEAYDWNRINVNAASLEMWSRLPGMTPDDAQAIVDYRTARDIRNISELAPLIPIDAYSRARPYLTTVSSPCYTIHAVGAVDGSPLIAGMAATVILSGEPSREGRRPRIVRKRPFADDSLVAAFRQQREIVNPIEK